jgi:hypothetical protein
MRSSMALMLRQDSKAGFSAASIHVLARRDDKTEATRDLAAQCADCHALLRNRGLRACGRYGDRRRAENGSNVHRFSLSLRVERQWANQAQPP